ncbi:MAG TPA: hypothetical protein VG821_06920 [Rhizomicrobium sp.]|nr:hypothetical protein [Rhizomicrobium sp.]
MNELGNKYALAALKDKRATLAGEIADLKKQLAWRVQQLDHVDACLTIFEPGFDTAKIGAKRPRRVKLFRQGELGRLIVDALRRAGKPLGTHQIVTALLAEGGYGESARPGLAPRVRGNLAYLEKAGKIAKAGRGKALVWDLVVVQFER